MRHFLYLMQGDAASIEAYAHLAEREHADAIFLTYDKPLEGALFAPETRWGEGRNRLLEAALEKSDYLYYIFCDNDIEFERGSWDLFEQQLLRYRPAIAVPMVIPKTAPLAIRWLNYQACLLNDEQLIAVHRQVVEDRIAVPYQEQFDRYHYWSTGLSQQIILKNIYFYDFIQFNTVSVSNEAESSHRGTREQAVLAKSKAREWLGTEFKRAYKSDWEHILYMPPCLVRWRRHLFQLRRRWYFQVVALWHTAVIRLRRLFGIGSDHALDERKLRRLLTPDSKLLRQYLQSDPAGGDSAGDQL